MDPEHRLVAAARSIAKEVGPSLARTAYQRGLAVTRKDGSTQAIPITATPVVVSQAELQRRTRLAALLARATTRMARAVLGSERAELILSALSPLERRLALSTGASVQRLVTTRVDYFVADRPWALEVNATIPAMQAYSDIASETYIEVLGQHAQLEQARIAQLIARNGSNSRALYQGLLACYAQDREDRAPRRIALLCRRNDAQLTEQQALAQRFRAYGTEADVIFPDELGGEASVEARGRPYDLVYRHLFVRRLEETPSPYIVELLEHPGTRSVVVNPPASQVEVKATFALLSQALGDPALAQLGGLEPEELEAIRQAVPWTRPFQRFATLDPDGERIADLVAHVAAHPERFVLKRSWDYGGKAVFVGASAQDASFRDRVKAAYGESLSWPQLCARAADDKVGGGFVVQQLIPVHAEPHLLCDGLTVHEVDLFVDFSAYASVGLDPSPAWGGVCRGSVSPIVNIVGGGGVLPLLTEDVATDLAAALDRS